MTPRDVVGSIGFERLEPWLRTLADAGAPQDTRAAAQDAVAAEPRAAVLARPADDPLPRAA
jgi:hypothetical protein